jgi:hypothetical protein
MTDTQELYIPSEQDATIGGGGSRFFFDLKNGVCAQYSKDRTFEILDSMVTVYNGVEVPGGLGLVEGMTVIERQDENGNYKKTEFVVRLRNQERGQFNLAWNIAAATKSGEQVIRWTGLKAAESCALCEGANPIIKVNLVDSKKASEDGGKVWWMNVSEIRGGRMQWVRSENDSDDLHERLTDLIQSLKETGKWIDPPTYTQESEHSDGPFGVVLEAIKAKGWPQWDESTDTAYMGVFNKVLGTSFSDPNEFSGDRCETLVMSIQKAKSIPKPVADAAHDPFADE